MKNKYFYEIVEIHNGKYIGKVYKVKTFFGLSFKPEFIGCIHHTPEDSSDFYADMWKYHLWFTAESILKSAMHDDWNKLDELLNEYITTLNNIGSEISK